MSEAKRVATSENPKSVESDSAPGPIVRHYWHHGFLRPGVTSNVVVPDQINDCISRIAPTCYVQVAVDDT
jgi:hypothetical protein